MTTSQHEVVTIEQARRVLGGRIGLVIGQAMSLNVDESLLRRDLAQLAVEACVNESLRAKLDVSDAEEMLDIFADADPDGYEKFRQKVHRYLVGTTPGGLIAKLSQVPWRAVISLCMDSHIENGLRDYLAGKPTQRRVTAAAAPMILDKPALLLPVFKPLGSCLDSSEQSRVALSRSEYRLRMPEWRRLMAPLPGYLKEGGLVFLGTSNSLNKTQDLLSALYAGQPPFPSFLIFTDTDPAGSDLLVSRLAAGRSEILRVRASDQQLLAALNTPSSSQLGLVFSPESNPHQLRNELVAYRSIIEQVPSEQPSYTLSSHRQEAVEGLFRPNDLSWGAYLFDLELPRSSLAAIHHVLQQVQQKPQMRPKFVVLRGEAGVGKTVVAKRLAVNLGRAGALVLWCKKTSGEFFHMYRDLAKELRKIQAKETGTRLFMFWDDPWSLGLAPIDFAAALESEGVDITVVIIGRNSDRAIARGFARLPPIDDEVELGFELTDEEEDALPLFLQRVGAIKEVGDAKHILSTYRGRNARDILCRLWYLLPDTRDQLERSLSDEYFRLEGVDRLVESLAESAATSNVAARRAYEAVAVASGLGFGIPDEVLVNTLHINYADWIEMCAGGKPLWGLLYPVLHPESEQYYYFTRNDIVTQILLRQINGGLGHAGEVRTLKMLVAACTGSSPVYRDFLIELLVKSKDKLKKIVSPNEGRELYELALQVFPVHDRTLMHHYAKWVTDELRDHQQAYEILERALETADYPYAANEERREFIHTSMAAVIVQRVKRGEQDRESALLAIKRHLREASTPTFFNLFTVHVQVNALVRLQTGDDPVSLDCFVEACRAIERAQQLTGANGRRQMRYQEALGLLENQKKELAGSLAPFAKLADEAMARFQADGGQLPLEAAALKGIIEASLTDKGSDYNAVYQFIQRCQEKISKARQTMSAGLRQARIDLIVRWRLQHDTGTVDWSAFLGDVRIVREEPAKRDDILLLFYEAVACFQLRLIDDSQAAFSRLRSLQVPSSLMAQTRIWLRSKTGQPEQVQGLLSKRSGRVRVRLIEYGYDALVYRDRAPPSAQDGATVHCWLGFTLQGPIAEFQPPSSAEIKLPA